MVSAFQVGERVTGSVQGLQPGCTYEVVEVVEEWMPFGCFVTYRIAGPAGELVDVRNGHLVLSRVLP